MRRCTCEEKRLALGRADDADRKADTLHMLGQGEGERKATEEEILIFFLYLNRKRKSN